MEVLGGMRFSVDQEVVTMVLPSGYGPESKLLVSP